VIVAAAVYNQAEYEAEQAAQIAAQQAAHEAFLAQQAEAARVAAQMAAAQEAADEAALAEAQAAADAFAAQQAQAAAAAAEEEAKIMAQQGQADAAFEAEMDAKAQDAADHCAAELRAAMKGFGTNEKRMIAAIAPASSRVLALTIHSFQKQFSRSLMNDIKDECSGNFEDACVKIFANQADADARSLYAAMDGFGTDEDRLDEILLFRSGHKLRLIQDAYRSIFESELIDDLADEVDDHALKLYQTALCERVPPNEHEVAADAKFLYDAGVGKTFGTDEETFARVLGRIEPKQLAAVKERYAAEYGHSIEHAISQEFDSILDDGDLKRCMANMLMGYGNFIGKRLHKAMKGMGTDDAMLMRLIFSHRDEEGVLAEANQYLLAETGKNLITWVKDETSGDYERMLVAVLQARGC
jgi:nucleoid-associated protein YgaU